MAKKSLKKGIFITFEGVEGSGKSTHARLIYRYLKEAGYDTIFTREPGGTRVGERIRRILLNPDNASLCDMTELFLFEASRSQIVAEVIRPALRKRRIVVCDRFFDATTVYQGCANVMDKKEVMRLNGLATGGLKPDLTIVLDIDIRKGLRRATRRRKKHRMEKKSLIYHRRVREGYRDIARREPRRVKLMPTQKDISDTQGLIRREVNIVVQRYKAAG
jgi:dTMP kinase